MNQLKIRDLINEVYKSDNLILKTLAKEVEKDIWQDEVDEAIDNVLNFCTYGELHDLEKNCNPDTYIKLCIKIHAILSLAIDVDSKLYIDTMNVFEQQEKQKLDWFCDYFKSRIVALYPIEENTNETEGN